MTRALGTAERAALVCLKDGADLAPGRHAPMAIRFEWRVGPQWPVALALPVPEGQSRAADRPAIVVQAMLDTGSSHTFADPRVFARLLATPIDRVTVYDVNGTREEDCYRLDLSVPYTSGGPGLLLKDFPISSGALTFGDAPRYYDIVLGMDALRFCRFGFDGPSGLFVLEQAIRGRRPTTLDLPASEPREQLRARVFGKGHGESVPTDVAAGETILPINDAVMFNPLGGQAIASRTSDGAQTDVLTYAGVQLDGGGSLVGPGAAPSTAPTLTLASGTGLGVGVYQFAYTDVTAAGESLPSPIASVTTGNLAAPASAPTDNGTSVIGVLVDGGTYSWAYSWVTSVGETTPSPLLSKTLPAGQKGQSLVLALAPAAATSINIYRTVNGGAQLKLVENVIRTTIVYNDQVVADGSLRANAPTSNTAAMQQVAISSIAVGASPTTLRKLYRTAVGASQLKLQQTIADDTTTVGVQDATPDASLGANAPTSDTSGLTQPSGQVNAGSTSLPTASAGPFQASGGWATLGGGQTVRYTGISANTLTGIPTSGPGAITTTVLYGSQVLPAPALTGVNQWNGLSSALMKGSKVSIWVQRDDLAAQAALSAVELDDDGNPTDGIREYTIADERSTEDRMIALCDADLAIMSRPIVSAVYYTRDTKSKSGRTVSIALTVGGNAWGEAGAFTIQSVDITFDAPTLNPLYCVHATSVAFTLSDLLRRVALT